MEDAVAVAVDVADAFVVVVAIGGFQKPHGWVRRGVGRVERAGSAADRDQ